MSRFLVSDGRIVVRDGQFVLARPGEPCVCCGPRDCAFFLYAPCVVGTPSEHCPVPDPVFVTTCWRCTSGGPSAFNLYDDQGFCWFRAGPQRYLPDPGTGEEPPPGFEWIPDGATVWDAIEGPCAPGCGHESCRTFDEFIPARKCDCSTGTGPSTAYFPCRDVAGTVGCFAAKLGGRDGGCYELDRQAPSVFGPIDPDLIIGAHEPRHDNCCKCCSSEWDRRCKDDILVLTQKSACPYSRVESELDVCCENFGITQIGYAIVLEGLPPRFWPCPPSVLEHWWYRDHLGGWLFGRYTHYQGNECAIEVSTERTERFFITCSSPLVWDMVPGAPNPDWAGDYTWKCPPAWCPSTMSLEESTTAGRFFAQMFVPFRGECPMLFDVSAAVVRNASPTGLCDGDCNSFQPSRPTIPTLPPEGADSPGGLGFGLRWVRDRKTGLMSPRVTHPSLPRVITAGPNTSASRSIARKVKPGGCSGCGKNDDGAV